jgi:hypothetical protein
MVWQIPEDVGRGGKGEPEFVQQPVPRVKRNGELIELPRVLRQKIEPSPAGANSFHGRLELGGHLYGSALAMG